MSFLKISLVSASLFMAINSESIANNDRNIIEDEGARGIQYNARQGADFNNVGGDIVIRWPAPVAPLGVLRPPELTLSSLPFDLAALLDEAPGDVRICEDGMVVIGQGISPYPTYFFD